jgi:AraC-like DNA-binding protein
VYVTGGSGEYTDHQNGSIRVIPGNCIVLFPGMAHSYWPTPEWHESFLVFQGNVFEQLERDGLISRGEPVLNPGLAPTVIASFNRLIRDFLETELPGDAILTARIHLLMAEVVNLHRRQSRAGEKENFSRAAAALLEQNLEAELDFDVIAREFHLSYERFRKRFAAEVGVSPARYRMLRRIDMAKTLLAENELPIKAVADRLGYCDLYFFCRQFKQVTGQTPAAFRRSV